MRQSEWSSTNDQIEFSNPENSITEVFGLSPGLTSLYLTISNGLCSPITDEIIIEVKGFNIPTVFSPNGDGLNETFEIKGLENLPEVKIRIYDDWGMELYSSQSYKNEWNGTFPSGRWIADGTYYYALEIEEELILGFIEIKR